MSEHPFNSTSAPQGLVEPRGIYVCECCGTACMGTIAGKCSTCRDEDDELATAARVVTNVALDFARRRMRRANA